MFLMLNKLFQLLVPFNDTNFYAQFVPNQLLINACDILSYKLLQNYNTLFK